MKIALPIDRDELLNIIKELESQNKFKNISHLCKAVEQTDWAKNFKPKPITSAVVTLRINQFKLLDIIATKPGKRGRQAGPLSQEHKDKLQASRGKKTVDHDWINELRRTTPDKYLPIVDKIEATPSLKKIIHLKCLECTNYNIQEIRGCSIKSCSLWFKRPYK